MKLTWVKDLMHFFTFFGGDDKGGGDSPELNLTPINVNSGFGNASFDPRTGQGGYTLDPRLVAMRDMFYSGANQFAPTAEQTQFVNQLQTQGQGLFNRGFNLDLNQVTQDYYNSQQKLLAPSRALEESQLADNLFKTGRTGAGVGYGGGYINPEQFSLLKAREEANAGMLLNAEDRARGIQAQDMSQGLGLLNTSNALRLQPYTNMANVFGLGTGIESLGFQPLGYAQQFNNAQLQANMAQLQADQQAQDDGKGGFGGFLGGVANVAGNVAGAKLGGALGSKVGGMFGGSAKPYVSTFGTYVI